MLNGPRITLIAGVFSILAVLCYMVCYLLSTERVVSDTSGRSQPGVGAMLGSAVRNRALISIIVGSVVMLLAQLTMQSMSNYIYPNYYGNVTAQSVSTLAMMVGMIVAAALAKPLSNRFGKAEISAASNLLSAAICILLFAIRPNNVWVYVLINLVSWFGLGVFAMVSWALITDVIDDAELRNGRREDGTIYALYSFARKLGQALSAGLTGALLSAIGYSDRTAFDEGVLRGIYDISTLVPALGFGMLALILWFWYPLHKRKVEENVERLRIKHSSDG